MLLPASVSHELWFEGKTAAERGEQLGLMPKKAFTPALGSRLRFWASWNLLLGFLQT